MSGAEPSRGAVEPLAVSPRKLIAASALASVLVVAIYLAAGGGSYEPTPVADPCAPREWTSPEGPEETAQQILPLRPRRRRLRARGQPRGARRRAGDRGVACGVRHRAGIDAAELEAAIRAGVVRAIDDAENAAVIDPLTADGLRAVVSRLPLDELIGLIYNATAILGGAGGLLP